MPDQLTKLNARESKFDLTLLWLMGILGVLLLVCVIFLGFAVAREWHNYVSPTTIVDTTNPPTPGPVQQATQVTIDKSNISNVPALFPLFTAFILFVGFLATIAQLQLTRSQSIKEQEWRKAEFIADQIKLFNKDRAVINTKRILEAIDAKRGARIDIFLVDPKSPHSTDAGTPVKAEIDVGYQDLMSAFTTENGEALTKIDVYTGKELETFTLSPLHDKIAYEIDEFFNYVIQFRKFNDDGIISDKDLAGLLYSWFDLIYPRYHNAELAKVPPEPRAILRHQFHKYLAVYYGADDDGICQYICRLLGYRFDEYLGKPELVAAAEQHELHGIKPTIPPKQANANIMP